MTSSDVVNGPSEGGVPRGVLRRATKWALARAGYAAVPLDAVAQVNFTRQRFDTSTPLPPGLEDEFRADHPRLAELRSSYATLDWPVGQHSYWSEDRVGGWLDLQQFRGDSPYLWHYRDTALSTRLKYFVYLEYTRRHDGRALLEQLEEDALFGCWKFSFAGRPECSRDLLDSVNEIYFLDRTASIFDRPGLRVLDIGAGYGRLAHRMSQAVPRLTDYCCVDAIPQSTFLCERYLTFRNVMPPARVVALPDIESLEPRSFDLAVNVHSFSECTFAAVRWWIDLLVHLDVPRLFVVPNEADGFLTTEEDGSRLDFGVLFERAGYRLVAEERLLGDPAVRDLLAIEDRHCLFARLP